jgi:hypothetical protein
MMSGLGDTLINVVIFAFIGLLVWLYAKPDGDDSDGE